MSAVIFLVISAGILLGSSVSKEYQCYQQINGGTARRNFSCQTIQLQNASNQTTTPPYSQTTPSSYPGCPQTLTCTESSFTSVGTITGSPPTTATSTTATSTTTAATSATTTITSDTTLTPTKSTALTTAPTTGVTLTVSSSIGSTSSSIMSTTSNATSATVTLSSLDSSTTFFTTTPATTSNFPSTTWPIPPAPILIPSQKQGAVIDPKNQVASVNSCFTFDSLNASLDTEEIWCQETMEDHCITNPCRNATCTSEPYRYRCVCAPGFTDPECMTQINLCENYPCDPFGTCKDFLNDYNCTCKAGFKFINRTYCEDIDECQLINTTATTSSTSTAPTTYIPCSNGSPCNNYPGGYECLCQKGKLGKYCEIDDKNELQTVTDIYPTFGLLAGGGLLNITGTNLNLYPHLGAFFKPENDSLKELYGFGEGNISDIIRIRIPRAPSTGYIGQNMSITIKYSNDKNLSVPQKYVYTDNPNISSISPSVIRIRVGVMLKIKGHNLNSVTNPVLKTKVIMKDEITASDHSVACRVINETDMVCRLPLIPEILTNTTSASRSKRNAVLDDAKFSLTNSKSFNRELNNLTDDWLEDKSSDLSANLNSIRFRRDVGIDNTTKNSSQIPYKIYMGLYFDNFPKYTNLTRSYPSYQPTLILNKPVYKVISPYSPQEFDPSLGESFKIRGEQMNDGLDFDDYNVTVGTGTCQPSHLEENLLECLPPKLKPDPGPLAVVFDCGENLPVMVGVGLLEPEYYACMKYIQSDTRTPLIIGLSVGLIGFIIVVIIIASLVYYFIKRKGRLQTDEVEDDESTTSNNDPLPSTRRVMADPELDQEETGGYFTNLDDDRRVTQEQSSSVNDSTSQRSRGQTRNYFFYGENNPDEVPVKKQPYGDFLKPRNRISYTRPDRQFDESTARNIGLTYGNRRMMEDSTLDTGEMDIAAGYSTNLGNDPPVNHEQGPSDSVFVLQRNRDMVRDYFVHGENKMNVIPVKKRAYGNFLKPKDRISYTRPNRQFDNIEENPLESNYMPIYHNMRLNNLDE